MGLRSIGTTLALMIAAGPAWAQGPQDTVRWIYDSLQQPGLTGMAYLSSIAERDRFFTRRMVQFFDNNDTYGDDLAAACIDFALEIPGQDYDAREIISSLTLNTRDEGTRQTVIAKFMTFGHPAEVHYDFIVEDGYWQIDDVAGPGWRVSHIQCPPKSVDTAPAAQSAPIAEPATESDAAAGAGAYCYDQDNSTLRFEILRDGNVHFDVESYQSNGHSCSAGGVARRTDTNWVYQENLIGGPCRIELEVLPSLDIRLSDPDWNCKPSLCGARAVLDGLTFSADSQVHCGPAPQR